MCVIGENERDGKKEERAKDKNESISSHAFLQRNLKTDITSVGLQDRFTLTQSAAVTNGRLKDKETPRKETRRYIQLPSCWLSLVVWA